MSFKLFLYPIHFVWQIKEYVSKSDKIVYFWKSGRRVIFLTIWMSENKNNYDTNNDDDDNNNSKIIMLIIIITIK
jgi:hypothetical protein